MTPSPVPANAATPERGTTAPLPKRRKSSSIDSTAAITACNSSNNRSSGHTARRYKFDIKNQGSTDLSAIGKNTIFNKKPSSLINQSHHQSTEDIEIVELAKNHNVNIKIAKKYHSVLIRTPSISVIKLTNNIKKEVTSPVGSSVTADSSLSFSSNNQIKMEPDFLKTKMSKDQSVPLPKIMNNYFNSMNIKQEIPSDHKAKSQIKMKFHTDSFGEDDFETPVPKSFQSLNEKLKPNPFAILKKRRAMKSKNKRDAERSKRILKDKLIIGEKSENIDLGQNSSKPVEKNSLYNNVDKDTVDNNVITEDDNDISIIDEVIKEDHFVISKENKKSDRCKQKTSVSIKKSKEDKHSFENLSKDICNKNILDTKSQNSKTESANSMLVNLESPFFLNCDKKKRKRKKKRILRDDSGDNDDNDKNNDLVKDSIPISFGASSEDELETTKKKKKKYQKVESKPKTIKSDNSNTLKKTKKSTPKFNETRSSKPIQTSDIFYKISTKDAIRSLPSIKKKVLEADKKTKSNDLTKQSSQKNYLKDNSDSSIRINGLINSLTSKSSEIFTPQASLTQNNETSSQTVQSNTNEINNKNYDNRNLDSSFEQLCKDVNRMSEAETITLYKSDDLMENSQTLLKPGLDKSFIRSRDPRLNRSISPIKFTSSVSRDPRLNRSLGCTPGASVAVTISDLPQQSESQNQVAANDSRLFESQLDDKNEQLENIADPVKEPKDNLSNAVDQPSDFHSTTPKRRLSVHERLGPKSALSTPERDDLATMNESSNAQTVTPRRLSVHERLGLRTAPTTPEKDNLITTDQSYDTQPTTPKRRLSVHERLGLKTPDKDRINEHLASMIPEGRKSVCYESDDDRITLYADDDLFDEEDIEASPRHSKFQLERKTIDEKMAYKPIEDHNRILEGKNDKNNLDFSSKRCNQGHSSALNQVSVERTAVTENQRKPWLQAAIARARELAKKPEKPKASLNDFIAMNKSQMREDIANYQTKQFENNINVTFGNDNVIIPNKATNFDEMSMLTKNTKPVSIVNLANQRSTFFKRQCFSMLRRGSCINNSSCIYKHEITHLFELIRLKNPEEIFHALDFALDSHFYHFIYNVWAVILPILHNKCFTAFEKLYKKKLGIERVVRELFNFCLKSELLTIESFVKKIALIVEEGDQQVVRIICSSIKTMLPDGLCWETIKYICKKAVPPTDIIELSILQCLKHKKSGEHILEVYDLVSNKMSLSERSKISKDMLDNFYKLAKEQFPNKDVLNTMPLSCSNVSNPLSRQEFVEGIKNQVPVQETRTNFSSTNVLQPNNSPLEAGKSTPKSCENIRSDYKLTQVAAGESASVWRQRYWKLYATVQTVEFGLTNEDYGYVFKMLDDFIKMEPMEDELLKRAVYQILCSNISASERHVAGIIKQAVRSSSMCNNMINILFDVGLWALHDLLENTLWTMAEQLLSTIKMIEPFEPRTDYILICAEIYIANNDPLEALSLFKKTRLIRTNRDEWLVNDSVVDHEKHRNKIVFLMLKLLSYMDPEKAFYLFKEILLDQYINYYPIDLPSWIDYLVLLMLYYKNYDLAVEMSRLVMDYDLTFFKNTYKELITCLLPIDKILSHQLLEYATYMGYYSKAKIIGGSTTLIIDINYTEEELYVVVERLINQLCQNLESMIEKLTPNQLKVFFIFEDIPNSKRLYKNEVVQLQLQDPYKIIKNKLKTLLAEKFKPAIKLSQIKIDKGIKIMSRSLVRYIKHWNASV